jgi:iron complex transport system substrate-binding protein
MKYRILFPLLILLSSCVTHTRPVAPGGMEYAQWFDLQGNKAIVTSPYGGATDTLEVDAPVRSIVCMSSSYIGFLDAIGCDSVATAVSGLAYVSDPEVQAHAVDVGYDAALDYETILKLRPDLVLTYAVSAAEPPYLQKLRDLGIRTAVIHEHLESHPLARAEYIKFFGLLTGRKELADSLFADIRDRYLSLVKETDVPKSVLVNIPYADQWYIPGGDNYMTRLIQDAGGTVLGAVPGRFESSVISVEKAFELAQEADCWLNPGWCATKAQLRSVHPLFADFPVLGKTVWNNTKQSTPGGGNAFWETGPAHPDLILEDLRAIFDGTEVPGYYYFQLE